MKSSNQALQPIGGKVRPPLAELIVGLRKHIDHS